MIQRITGKEGDSSIGQDPQKLSGWELKRKAGSAIRMIVGTEVATNMQEGRGVEGSECAGGD